MIDDHICLFGKMDRDIATRRTMFNLFVLERKYSDCSLTQPIYSEEYHAILSSKICDRPPL